MPTWPLALAAALWGVPAPSVAIPAPAVVAPAHEVPANVTVQLWVAPTPGVLTVLVRTPLESIRDVQFPLTADGFLALEGIEPFLAEGAQLWVVDELRFFEDGAPLPRARLEQVRLTLPSDRSFGSWDRALAHVRGPPMGAATRIPVGQVLLDVELSIPITDPEARFTLEPGLDHLGVRTRSVIHFLRPDGSERSFQYVGDPGRVRLDPTWLQAASRFVQDGFLHILGGIDHLLFLLCLVIPYRKVRPLVPVVTAFTVAHSITLVAAASGLTPRALWFPALVETLIALSIVYMAIENLLGSRLDRRWGVAFGFGLIHGLGFAFALQDTLQFAGTHLLAALLAFNVGVELGQLLLLVLAVPLLGFLLRRVPERGGLIVLSALVAHQAWHWMTARGSELLRYEVRVPVWDALLLASVLRWAAVALVAVGAAWGLAELYGRIGWAGPGARPGEARTDPQGA